LPFQSFDYERTWWRLFQKRAVRTKFDIYVFILSRYLFDSIHLNWRNCYIKSNYIKSYKNQWQHWYIWGSWTRCQSEAVSLYTGLRVVWYTWNWICLAMSKKRIHIFLVIILKECVNPTTLQSRPRLYSIFRMNYYTWNFKKII
jgi:hypothetical protein